MKKIPFILSILVITTNLFSLSWEDFLYPRIDKGIASGINFSILDFNHPSYFLVNPNLNMLKTWEKIGLYSEIGTSIMNNNESLLNYYYLIQPSLSLHINTNNTFNILLSHSIDFNNNFKIFNWTMNPDVSISGRSEYNFDYRIGIKYYNSFEKELENGDINPYLYFKIFDNTNILLEYNLLQFNYKTNEGSFLELIKIAASYEIKNIEFGIAFTSTPILTQDRIYSINPFFEYSKNGLRIFNKYNISLNNGDVILGGTIGIKYLLMKL